MSVQPFPPEHRIHSQGNIYLHDWCLSGVMEHAAMFTAACTQLTGATRNIVDTMKRTEVERHWNKASAVPPDQSFVFGCVLLGLLRPPRPLPPPASQ